jgi:hypothetical protein
MEWKSFLELLPDDILEKMSNWSYVMHLGGKEHPEDKDGIQQFVVAVDLDASTLMNHGSATLDHHGHAIRNDNNQQDNLTAANVVLEYSSDGTSQHYVATRDIQIGEEILCDYSEFHVYDYSLDWYMETYHELCQARLRNR